MYPAQIAQNGDTWHILAMESEDTVGLGIEVTLLLGQCDRAVVFMLTIICGSDFSE